jgi:hypothetical protein
LEGNLSMAISSRMLAVLQKVHDAEMEHFAELQRKAVQERIRRQSLQRNLAAKRKPPIKKPT